MKIKIQYEEQDGTIGIINHLGQHNAGCANEADRDRLRQLATSFAAQWAIVFPGTKFDVIEIEK
jgi:hypothetical protein